MNNLRKWLTVLQQLLCSGTNRRQQTKAKRVGDSGEHIASSYLTRSGWKIIARNLRFGQDELDILALDPSRNYLVIVEVRTTASGGSPERTITTKKRRALARIARNLKGEAIRHKCLLRADAVTLRIGKNQPEICHFKAVTAV